MDNRISICSITIKNFRSIRRETIKVGDFNIFVGMNDAGKSNVLKALNLFFNDKVDDDTPYDYQRDFSYLYPPNSKEAKAITISIQFNIPTSFSDGGMYLWKKMWKETGKISDDLENSQGMPPGTRSRIRTALQRIKFRYVPAVKSANYYKTLLSNLYSSVDASLDPTFSESVQSFSNTLSVYTETITSDISRRLHLSSQLKIPEDLNEIFKALVFRTSRSTNSINVPLTSRGDGIQARYIPIILKYIAYEDQKSRNQGSTKVTTIWGFEEPENGLELSNAFALADEFAEYSKDLQIFITTHSPAFYMKKEDSGASIFYVEKKSRDSEETKIITGKSNNNIAYDMGLMPLVAPFIADKAHELEVAQNIYRRNILTDVPTIMVEGETDINYLTLAIRHLSQRLQTMLDESELRIVCKNDGAGTTQLCNWALAWIYSGFKSKLYILLDHDAAGEKAHEDIITSEVYKNRNQSLSIKVQYIEPSEEIIYLYDKRVKFLYEIEYLCSFDVWDDWKKHKWIELRSDIEMHKMFEGLIPRDKTLDNVIDDLVDIGTRDTILSFKPKDLKKTKMVNWLGTNYKDNPDAFTGFKRTIVDIERYFNNTQ